VINGRSDSVSVSTYKNDERAIEAKIVLLGDAGTGKTSLVKRFVEDSFSKDEMTTVGAAFMTKRMVIGSYKLKLQIWDTAGQERFRSMTPMYYRGASAAILVYDITSMKSFAAVKSWVLELNDNKDSEEEERIVAIAGNKVDLEQNREVPFEEAKQYASDINALIYETSAINNLGVEDMFLSICNKLIARTTEVEKRRASLIKKESYKDRLKLNEEDDKQNNKSKRCCK
jgi:Ras-related protein Rab-21